MQVNLTKYTLATLPDATHSVEGDLIEVTDGVSPRVYVYLSPTWTPLSTSQLPSSTYAGLPAAGNAGRLIWLTDNIRGIWRDDGTKWASLTGEARVDDFGGDPTGVADSMAAINAAMTAVGATAHSDIPVAFTPGGTYKVTAPLTIPVSGGNVTALTFQTAGGSYYRATIQFTDTTAGHILFDFSVGTAYPTFRNLILQGTGGGVATANSGTGIKLGSATHAVFDNLRIERFNIGLHNTSDFYYSRISGLRCYYNYSYGLYSPSGLWNATEIQDSSFSYTVNGTGAYFIAPGANFTCRHCYFEGNADVGINLSTFINANLDGCYFESNASYDLYAHGIDSAAEGYLTVSNSYFDPDLDKSHYRIRLNNVRTFLFSNTIHQTGDGNPPILEGSNLRSQPSVAINNTYDTEALGVGSGWIVIDSKHPAVRNSANDTTAVGPQYLVSAKAGDVIFNAKESTAPYLSGWYVTQGGAGTGISNPTATATTTATSATIGLSDIAHTISPGDLIQIAGVDFGAGAAASAMVIDLPTNNTAVLNAVANQSVSGAAITYRAAAFQAFPTTWRLMTDVASSGSGAQTLTATTIPAGTHVVGAVIRVTVAGTKTGGNGDKTINIRLGGNSYTFNATANDTNDWRGEATVMFTGAATQRITWFGFNGATPLQGYDTYTDTTADAYIIGAYVTLASGSDTITMTMCTYERLK